jgi:hypothetical protein
MIRELFGRELTGVVFLCWRRTSNEAPFHRDDSRA